MSPTTDSSSPITDAGASGTDDTAITFTAEGGIQIESYFCTTPQTTRGGVRGLSVNRPRQFC